MRNHRHHRHASGEGKGQGENYGYLFHDGVPSLSQVIRQKGPVASVTAITFGRFWLFAARYCTEKSFNAGVGIEEGASEVLPN